MQGIVLDAGFPNIEGYSLINVSRVRLGTSTKCCRLLSVGKPLETGMTRGAGVA